MNKDRVGQFAAILRFIFTAFLREYEFIVMIPLLLTKLLFSLSVVIAAIFLISNSNESFLLLNSIEHFSVKFLAKVVVLKLLNIYFGMFALCFERKTFPKCKQNGNENQA
jgi:hypothetical protein